MLSGEVPFNSLTTHRTAEEIVEDITRSKLSYETPAWKNVSQGAKDLVRGAFEERWRRERERGRWLRLGLLTVDPSKRLTIKDLSRNAWLRSSSVLSSQDHPQFLLTPNILSQASRSLIVSSDFSGEKD